MLPIKTQFISVTVILSFAAATHSLYPPGSLKFIVFLHCVYVKLTHPSSNTMNIVNAVLFYFQKLYFFTLNYMFSVSLNIFVFRLVGLKLTELIYIPF